MKSIIDNIIRALIHAVFPIGPCGTRVRQRGEGAIQAHFTPKLERGHISLLPYSADSVRDFIRAIKYERDAESIRIAADILRKFLSNEHQEMEMIEKTDYIICAIPATRTRKRSEGYNHIYKILDAVWRGASDIMFARDDRHILRWRQPVRRQSTIRNRTERIHNVANMMYAEHPVPPNTTCIVIDDVTTTGATLSEARRALIEAGAYKVISVALARG